MPNNSRTVTGTQYLIATSIFATSNQMRCPVTYGEVFDLLRTMEFTAHATRTGAVLPPPRFARLPHGKRVLVYKPDHRAMGVEMTYIEQAQLKRRLRDHYGIQIEDFAVPPFIEWVDPADPQNPVPIPDNPPTFSKFGDEPVTVVSSHPISGVRPATSADLCWGDGRSWTSLCCDSHVKEATVWKHVCHVGKLRHQGCGLQRQLAHIAWVFSNMAQDADREPLRIESEDTRAITAENEMRVSERTDARGAGKRVVGNGAPVGCRRWGENEDTLVHDDLVRSMVQRSSSHLPAPPALKAWARAIRLNREQCEVFDSLFTVITHEDHIRTTYADFAPGTRDGGCVYMYKVTHDKLRDNIEPARQNECIAPVESYL
ncbi:hypothetical protein K466DRAFT_568780 [Polyporus arcularius HHB13444]|uniref:Uncharacterized protein n=1 Tax=Polyporus arcularius HHB13444 TaxID=1314778 RepID=A0A5C3NX34_9APHY|nr:hypothetical protein K466DRAFT_568780 [Polyporus arcularius HHB13444]